VTNSFNQSIEEALNSGNPQIVLEGTVAFAIQQAGIHLVNFNKQVGPNGAIGEIDVETTKAIVEVTTQTSRKLKQIQKFISDPDLNPLSKAIILYAPNYKNTPAQDIVNAGAYVVRNDIQLIQLLQQLGE